MSDSSRSSDDDDGTGRSISRRTVLNGAVGTGALALGVGGVAANGKGGQGFVAKEDFDENGTVVIKEFNGDEGRRKFSCGGKAGVSFPYWTFRYESDPEDTEKRLYTRDNTIDTDVTYRWTNDKPCNGEYEQVGFAVD